ncbi:hypothetical protein BGZ65_002354 [Modicella reniformis]|uniref:Uncharacterized protein n=1 Tax=Modicella reniformis TaxID=1440133 RepID=A0A9P6J0Q4_9FUNG|nr:hypothetical protein BGZ65_002354 [Modicella reniformis]
MRSLLEQAFDRSKRRHAEIERRIKCSEVKGENGHGHDHEEPFSWEKFRQLYYRSDLFKWHRDVYLGDDGILDLEEMKRTWVENEERRKKKFIKAVKKCISEDGSENIKKAKWKKG